ncbi:hypothetical protein [Mucilaginibacter antarcticus]|uniref:Uncharacterized protein n=1 Tax=Mucilaginibacter antarcticus TaxID=1855725 RepID=A0ABW5XNL4_9SPHI
MKRNLLKGITILISAVALSSCSELSKLAKTSYAGDDVYYTKAQAGDTYDNSSMYTQANNTNTRNDDYYYYGDYQTRINRFSYSSPFAYDYDYYYDYNPYYANTYSYGFGGVNQAPVYDYAYSPYYDMGVYSAYDFGYGSYWGVGNYGYGNIFSSFIGGGGVSTRSRIKTYPSVGGVIVGNASNAGGLAFTRGGTGGSAASAIQNGLSFSRGSVSSVYPNSRPLSSNTVYPGRPNSNTTSQVTPSGTNRNPTNNQAVRPMTEAPRTYTPPPTVERAAPPSQSSGGGSSSGSSSSSGGGGRPVRP